MFLGLTYLQYKIRDSNIPSERMSQLKKQDRKEREIAKQRLAERRFPKEEPKMVKLTQNEIMPPPLPHTLINQMIQIAI